MFLHRKFPRKKHKQNNNATQIERVVRAYLRAKCRVDRPTHANKWTPEGVVFSSANKKKRKKEKKQERTSNESRSDRPILSRPSKSKKKKKLQFRTPSSLWGTLGVELRGSAGAEREREREIARQPEAAKTSDERRLNGARCCSEIEDGHRRPADAQTPTPTSISPSLHMCIHASMHIYTCSIHISDLPLHFHTVVIA